MKFTIIAIGLALGLSTGAAMATNTTSCTHSQQQATFHCTTPDGTNYTVSNVNSAEAAAAAIATGGAGGAGGNGGAGGSSDQSQGQGQNQGQEQSSENNNQNVNGGNSVQISNPSTVRTYGASVVLNIDAAEILDGPNKRANRTAMSYGALGYPETGKAVLDSTYWGKKANKLLASQPTPETTCYMDKDGVIHVYPMSTKAACLATHGF